MTLPIKPARLTVVTSNNPKRLTKQFLLSDTDELIKVEGGTLVEGHAQVEEFDNLLEFSKILMKLNTSNALIYGVPPKKQVKLTTTAKWEEGGQPDDVIPRTKKHFDWPAGPGILMFDYDPQSGSSVLKREELVQILREAVPGLANVSFLWWASASSYIKKRDTNSEVKGLNGQRLYLLVNDARDIPRATDALVEALWANGHGYFEISKSGALLGRLIVDTSVWQTNRLDFASGASCVKPLYQDRGEPVIIEGEIEIADTKKAIPDPTLEIKMKAAANKATAKKEKQEEAGRVQEQWVEERVIEIVGKATGEDVRELARNTAIRAVDKNVLAGDFIIHVGEGKQTQAVSVSTVLDDPARFHGLTTLDPIEPDYKNKKIVGKLYVSGARPRLHSFAHGGRTFQLIRQPTEIELVKGKTHETVITTLEHLRRNPCIFDFGGALVTVDEGRIKPLDDPSLSHFLGGITQYWYWTKLSKDLFVKTLEDPPMKVVKAILSQGISRNLKCLNAVVTVPTLRPDGTVMDVPGYDEETGLLYEVLEGTFERVPQKPNTQKVQAALDTLLHPFNDFPLCGPDDWGVLLAALLTAAVRPAIPTSPAFGFDAPVQASGKTLLAMCVGMLTSGFTPTVWPHTHGRDDEEIRKRLFTALRNGDRAIVWDNVTGTFDSAAMAAALTAPNFTDRVLGKSERMSIPNRAVILMTGNNLTLTGDMPRRILKCRIDPKIDRPFAREFKLDPLEYVRNNRRAMIVAGLTLVRGRLASSDARAKGRMASFEMWDDYVRQTVAWIGKSVCPGKFSDPMEAVNSSQSDDPEQEILSEVFDAWRQLFGESYVASGDVLNVIQGRNLSKDFGHSQILRETLMELNSGRDVTTSRAIGRILSYRRGRHVGGYVLQSKGGISKKKKLWWVSENV